MQYRGWDPDKAIEDYYKRIQDHEKHYEPVEEKTWPYIRIMNVILLSSSVRSSTNVTSSGWRKDHG
jgi:hypothetical protein